MVEEGGWRDGICKNSTRPGGIYYYLCFTDKEADKVKASICVALASK